GGPGTDDPGRISVDGFHLRRLLLSLHNLRDDQLRAPDWMRDVQVDIVAKVPPGVTSVQARQMLAKLIEERFQMKLHRESESRPVYNLIVAKGGPKMKLSPKVDEAPQGAIRAPDPGPPGPDGFSEMPESYVRVFGAVTMERDGRSKTIAIGESMPAFAEHLTRHLDDLVFDKTGLTGTYAFSFIWVKDFSSA